MQTGLALTMGMAGVPEEAAAPASFALTLLDDGTLSIDGATGAITIEITTPAEFAGTYTQDIDGRPLTADLVAADRFVCLVRPVVSGTPFVGLELSAATGLWIYSGAEPTFTYQWTADGAAIAAATSDTYTLTAGESGQTVAVDVTATQGGATVPATSLGLTVAGTTAFVDDFTTYSDGQNLLLSGPYSALSANPGPSVTHSFDYAAANGAGRMARGGSSRLVYFLASAGLGDDQVIEAAFAGDDGGQTKVWGVVARGGGADNAGTGYQLVWSGFSNVIALARRVSGGATNLVVWDDGGAGYMLQTGDRLRLTATGTSLLGELRPVATGVWQPIGTATDTQIASGAGGLAYLANGAAAGQFGYVNYFRALG
jgi:hypothetical protein